MKQLRAKIVQDTKVVVFHHPTENCVMFPEDEGSHLLKRRAPRRPPLNPAPPGEDDNSGPATQDET